MSSSYERTSANSQTRERENKSYKRTASDTGAMQVLWRDLFAVVCAVVVVVVVGGVR